VTRAQFIAPARREFLNEVAFYNEQEAGLGARFAAAIEEAVTRAMAFPFSGSRSSANTRRLLVKDFPFAIVYRHDERGIVIFAVAHHSRRPDYWRPRVQDR
jgi:plasmid stabilization system protein ParE